MKTLEAEYLRRCLTKTDINEHLPTLRSLASECDSIVEFGTRSGNSTTALLAGEPQELLCVDISFRLLDQGLIDFVKKHQPTLWTLRTASTRTLKPADIQKCDLLFIDTLHTYDQIAHELTFAPRVRRYIAVHDVVLFGDKGEHREPGITRAILDFLETKEGRCWAVDRVALNNNGMAVLRREVTA